jgi:pyridoxal phosphate enzyme (YggS family)
MNHTLIRYLQESHPEVTLVMASKYLTAPEFQTFIDANIQHFGENRVDDFLAKKVLIKASVTWHFIGTLQSKKVKKVINEIDVLHTLDRLSLVAEIEKHRRTPLEVFIQCNISNEANKHGVDATTLKPLLEALKSPSNIIVKGVMGMAEDTHDLDRIKTQFQTLKDYLRTVQTTFPNADACSMGMSQDYEIALEMGATHLRLGRILLEEPDATS